MATPPGATPLAEADPSAALPSQPGVGGTPAGGFEQSDGNAEGSSGDNSASYDSVDSDIGEIVHDVTSML